MYFGGTVSPSIRLILALLALLLGWLTPVHAVPPPVPAPIEIIAPVPDQAQPDVIIYLAAYRANGPPTAEGRAPVFFVVCATSGRSAWWNLYAYCGGDPVNRADPTGLAWRHINSQWTWIPDEGEPDVPPTWQPKPADDAISLNEMLALQKVDFPTMKRVYLNPSEASVLAELLYGRATTPDGWIASTREASENRNLASDRAAKSAKLAQYAADPTALDVDVWDVNAKRAKLKLFMAKSKIFDGYVKVVGPTADLIMLSESIPFLAAGGISSAIRNDAVGNLQTLMRGGSALTEQGRGKLAQYFSRFSQFQRELKDVNTAGTRAHSLAFDPAIGAPRVGEGRAALEFEMTFGTTLERSAHAGVDFVGSQGQFAGKTFDFVGAELKSEFFKLQGPKGFARSITDHLGSSDYTVLYLRRLSPSQVLAVNQFLTTLSATDLAKILILK